ncbi:hypothetical protein ACE14D_04930 [Streptomyces sp. Act-28]
MRRPCGRREPEGTGPACGGVDLGPVGHAGGVEPKAHPLGLKPAGRAGTPAASLKAAQAGKPVDADPETKYPVTVDPSTSALGNVLDT